MVSRVYTLKCGMYHSSLMRDFDKMAGHPAGDHSVARFTYSRPPKWTFQEPDPAQKPRQEPTLGIGLATARVRGADSAAVTRTIGDWKFMKFECRRFAVSLSLVLITEVLLLPLLCPEMTSLQAQTLPSTPGWYEIPNTRIRPSCPTDPTIQGFIGCKGVTAAWNSGWFDTRRNRLMVWGGGHGDYYGNEIYALDLNTLSMKRLTDPGLPAAPSSTCIAAIAGGTQPNSRHTYDGLTYMANVDKLFVFGGCVSCGAGGFLGDTWTFDLPTLKWERRYPSGTGPRAGVPGQVVAYDPNTGKVFIHDRYNLFSYDPTTNSYQKLSAEQPIDYHLTAVVDPVRKKLVMIGYGQQWVYDIAPGSSYVQQPLNSTGGTALVSSLYPGLAYDPVSDRIVAWNGGNTVYSLDMNTRVWTPITYAGGPGAANVNGTYKRWSYSPAAGGFVVVNSIDANAWFFRVGAGTTDKTAPSVSMTAPATGTTVVGASVTVSASASDDVGVSSVQFQLDGANLNVEKTGAPYSTAWNTNTTPNGTHTLTAVARDVAGNQTTSTGITVNVNNIADTQPPTNPTNLVLSPAASGAQMNLTWTASSDNLGVAGYRIFRGSKEVGTSTTNSYQDTGLSGSTSYSYAVSAYDAAGNNSGLSNTAAAMTSAFTAFSIPANQWVVRTSPRYPNSPGAHNKHVKMTYDSDKHVVYLYGGDYVGDGGQNSREMVYSYDVAADKWNVLLNYADSGTPGFPEGRCAPGWSYDSKRKVVWMGMGQNRQPTPRPGLLRGGLWSFDPNEPVAAKRWHLEGPDVPNVYSTNTSSKLPANPNGDVWYMLHEIMSDSLYVAEGLGATSRVMAKYDLNNLTIKDDVSKDKWSPASTLLDPSPYLGVTSYAVDTKRNKIVFYSPWPGPPVNVNRGETWEFTPPSTWVKLSDTVLPAKCCFGMVYDSANDKVVLFGGYDSHEGGTTNPLNQTWVFDRNPSSPNYHKWIRLTPTGSTPSPRKGETIAYDSYNNVIVQFGGTGWETVGQPDSSGYYGYEIFLLRLGGSTPPAAPGSLHIIQ
jgi:hypothetical protein